MNPEPASVLDDLRLRLERYLGQDLRPATWQYLVDEGKVTAVVRREQDLNWLSQEVHKFWEAAGQRGTTPPPARLLTQEQRARAKQRDEVLSILLAQEAARHEGVADFRRTVLKGRLLNREEVDLWFVRQQAADGDPTEWLTHVPVPSGYRVTHDRAEGGYITEPPLKITKATAARGVRIEGVEYAGGAGSGRIATSAGGVLEQLRRLSVELEEMFGWTQAEATTYVVTGGVPYVPPMKIIGPEKLPPSRLLRVVLEIDLALTPRQVADRYRRMRREWLGARLRALSPKHLSLAGFIAQRPADELWPDRLRAWNRAHPPDWKYKNEAYFKRDSLVARQRLLASALTFGPEVEAESHKRRPRVDDNSGETMREVFAAALRGWTDGLAQRRKRDYPPKRGSVRVSRSPVRLRDSAKGRHAARLQPKPQFE